MTGSQRSRGTSVLVVGAGLGGLTAAVALQRAGIQVTVLERAAELREVGAGVSVWPNALNALRRLGLGDAVERAGVRVGRTDVRDWRGHVLHGSSTESIEARFGAPVLMIHRADLHAALCAPLDVGVVRLDVAVDVVEQDSAGVRVRRADGGVHRADVAIGADGLNSAVRAAVLSDGPPRYSGLTAWRAVVTVPDAVATRVTGSETWGHGSVFGMQRVSANRVYWYAGTRAPEGSQAPPDAQKAHLADLFGSWHEPIPQLLDATPGSTVLHNDL
jgi:2-polyprenyl-6-methoxyphenol hydroxylase-like FAD-dependent oxidoreductase